MSEHQLPSTAPVENWYQVQAQATYSIAVLLGLTFPGALLGCLAAAPIWALLREPLGRRLVFAAACVLTVMLTPGLDPEWFWKTTLVALRISPAAAAVLPSLHTVSSELVLGPPLLLLLHAAHEFRIRTALGRMSDENARMRKRAKALQLGYQGNSQPPNGGDGNAHPGGKIRLGIDERRRPFDFEIAEVLQHVFIPGATGTGKTTTLMRLASGAIANGFGVVIIDCKGVGLAKDAKALAERHGLKFNTVDPFAPKSLGYDTCTGDPSHVANKLVGAFSFSSEAEIYKQVALGMVPLIAKALMAAGEPITLQRIHESLGPGGLARLGRTTGVPESLRDSLSALEAERGVAAGGRTGLQQRLGALLQGRFGELFQKTPALDWSSVTRQPSVTYFSLSATATGEDVELFGRVITQDLKQFCDTRLRAISNGADLSPLMVIYDEFAALREATQIVDLLLQARQARICVVAATQYFPEEVPIRTPLLQSGTIVCHRVAGDDAEAIAAEIGTRETPKVTTQIEFETGESKMGSIRSTREYHIHPDTLKTLPTGMAAVLARRTNRRELVRILIDNDPS